MQNLSRGARVLPVTTTITERATMNNQITVTGNLTADPEIKFFDSGAVKTGFSVAVSRQWTDTKGEKQEQTSFVEVSAWRYLAEDCARALSKGSRVTVTGRIEQQSWEDKTDGSKRSKIVIVADEVSVACSQIESYERRKRENAEGSSQGQNRQSSAPKASQGASRAPQTRVTSGARKPVTSREEILEEDPF